MRKFCVIAFLLVVIIGGLWFRKDLRPHYAKIPVYYFPFRDSPMLDVKIEWKTYHLFFDSGTNECIELRARVLNELNKKQRDGVAQFTTLRGGFYETAQFLIPTMKIINCKYFRVPVRQENLQHKLTGSRIGKLNVPSVQKELQYVDGKIGMGMLESMCLFLDLPNSFIYIAEDEAALYKEKSFSLKNFVKVPLLAGDRPILSFDTEKGTRRFLLDTGATHSILRDSEELYWKAIEHLSINGIDLGPQEFITLNIAEDAEMDGILGIDFLRKHSVFLDMKNKKACVGPTVEAPKLVYREPKSKCKAALHLR
jgi:hypothetical protein